LSWVLSVVRRGRPRQEGPDAPVPRFYTTGARGGFPATPPPQAALNARRSTVDGDAPAPDRAALSRPRFAARPRRTRRLQETRPDPGPGGRLRARGHVRGGAPASRHLSRDPAESAEHQGVLARKRGADTPRPAVDSAPRDARSRAQGRVRSPGRHP